MYGMGVNECHIMLFCYTHVGQDQSDTVLSKTSKSEENNGGIADAFTSSVVHGIYIWPLVVSIMDMSRILT
jgi:hypothetical protein